MRRVKVKFSPLHSSLVNLPLSVYGPLVAAGVRPQSVAVHLSNAKKGDQSRVAYLGWTGLASASSSARWTSKQSDDGIDTIEIDPQLCTSLGFSEGDILELGLIHDLPVAKSVTTEPVSTDDWEILELHAQFVEDNLLSQVRVAAVDQIMHVWVLGKTLIHFRVSSLDHSGPCLLSTSTELIIAPKPRKRPQVVKDPIPGANEMSSIVARVLRYSLLPKFSDEVDMSSTLLVSTSVMRRMNIKNGDEVYIQRVSVPIEKLVKEIKYLQQSSKVVPPKDIAMTHLKDEQSKITSQPMIPGEREDQPFVVKESDQLPANHVTLLPHHGISDWDLIRLSPRRATNGDVKPSNDPRPVPGPSPLHLPATMRKRALAGVDHLIGDCMKYIKETFMAQNFATQISIASPQILLCGAKGCGKTSISAAVALRLEEDATLRLCPLYVDLARFTDESLAGIRSLFSLITRLSMWHKPTLLILDNLHQFVGIETEHTESFKTTQIAQLFINFLQELSKHSVAVILTAESSSSLHKVITNGYSFSKTVAIKSPNKDARAEILNFVVNSTTTNLTIETENVNWAAIATMTEGYSAQDLKDLTNKALHQAIIRQSNNSTDLMNLTVQDFESAQANYTPLSVRDLKLQKSEVEWADIGGLHETRRVLRETLEWPTKYAAIFAKCPLRLRSGLLLYGYPGCGKTLLASAVSKECGLNFISVKGPELLNKYIGASEKSVRELFERASAAKPCVLFFDEFDSIAPRRGHDSTGVTDRVVNQMLTQMDGAEGLDGVYVLAATSRPDLIDPALLRPGRLDKSLLCHMPTLEERREILSTVSRKMHIYPDIDFAKIAATTEGFSGADLQALIYNAHLESVHTLFDEKSGGANEAQPQEKVIQFVVLSNDQNKPITRAESAAASSRLSTIMRRTTSKDKPRAKVESAKKPVITTKHIEKALSSTRPSISDVEKLRLDRIYQEFSSDRSQALPQPPEANTRAIGNRASLM
ncbi:AAA-domain-containing protein [Serendipita vermifera]|nr:AAA-domain-containing protein [Serendipita vermifera]